MDTLDTLFKLFNAISVKVDLHQLDIKLDRGFTSALQYVEGEIVCLKCHSPLAIKK